MNTPEQPGISLKTVVTRFLPPVISGLLVGLISAGVGVYVMVHLMDARVSDLEKLSKETASVQFLENKITPIQAQLERHEKALERDFQRHERTVLELAHKTEDQERRLTRLETLVTQTQQLLKEISADVKVLLRGGQQ